MNSCLLGRNRNMGPGCFISYSFNILETIVELHCLSVTAAVYLKC